MGVSNSYCKVCWFLTFGFNTVSWLCDNMSGWCLLLPVVLLLSEGLTKPTH